MMLRLLAVLLLAAAPRQDGPARPLEAVLKDFVARKEAAGLVAAVGGADRALEFAVAGMADLGGSAPMAKDTIFQIASMTKPITLIAVMMLADEGKLSIDDAVEKHLPEFKGQMLVKSKSADETVLVKPGCLLARAA